MRHQPAGVLERERLDVDDLRGEARGRDGGLALLDVLGARRHQQHVERIVVLLGRAEHLEVVADLVHRERDVLVGLQFDLRLEVGGAQVARHLDHLGDRRVAADRDGHLLAAVRLAALYRATDRFADRPRCRRSASR